jgi:hypothetical protein
MKIEEQILFGSFLLWFEALYWSFLFLFGVCFVIQTQAKSSLTLSLREAVEIYVVIFILELVKGTSVVTI